MTRTVRALALVAASAAALAAPPAGAVPHLKKTEAAFDGSAPLARFGGGSFSYTLEIVSPTTQMQPEIDGHGPYFFFELTNTGDPDTYHMVVTDIDDPINWFGQVCIGFVCFPDSADHSMGTGESDSVGVNVVPFTDGVDTFTFTLSSIGNPALVDVYELTLYAGNSAVGVEHVSGLGPGWELRQNRPNPVRAGTSIGFALPHEQAIDLRVYDVTGRVVRTLTTDAWPQGAHSVDWDGKSDAGAVVPAGVYFYRLVTSEGSLARRLTVLR